jgi:hypothetical protein
VVATVHLAARNLLELDISSQGKNTAQWHAENLLAVVHQQVQRAPRPQSSDELDQRFSA